MFRSIAYISVVIVIVLSLASCSGAGSEVVEEDEVAAVEEVQEELTSNAYLKSSYELQKIPIHVSRFGIRSPDLGGFVHAVGYADFDRDGYIDVLMSAGDASENRTPMEFYRYDPALEQFIEDDSIFTEPLSKPSMVHPRKILVGDYNNDGWPDAFVIGHGYDQPPWPGEYPILLLSDGQGRLVSIPYTQVVSFQHGGASADIDHDNDLDIFVIDHNGTSFFLINDGTGTFTYDSARVPSGGQKRFTAELVDVDGDGAIDLITGGHDHEGRPAVIAWGDMHGRFSFFRQTMLPGVDCYGRAIDIEVEDLDADGDKEIIINRTSGGCGAYYAGFYVQVLRNNGDRTFTDATSTMIPNGSSSTNDWIDWLRISDVNGDGKPDLIADDSARGLVWLNQNGVLQGELNPRSTYTNDEYGFSIQYPIHWEPMANPYPGWIFICVAPIGTPRLGVSRVVPTDPTWEPTVEYVTTALTNAWTTDVVVHSITEVVLDDGTPAHLIRVDWIMSGWPHEVLLIRVEKDGMVITADVIATSGQANIEQMEEILLNLTLD